MHQCGYTDVANRPPRNEWVTHEINIPQSQLANAGFVAELFRTLQRDYAPTELSAVCHWGFDSCPVSISKGGEHLFSNSDRRLSL